MIIDRNGTDSQLVRFVDQFTAPMNFAGIPGISLPAGRTADGLPIGVQFVGNDYAEAILLRAAGVVEQALAGQQEKV